MRRGLLPETRLGLRREWRLDLRHQLSCRGPPREWLRLGQQPERRLYPRREPFLGQPRGQPYLCQQRAPLGEQPAPPGEQRPGLPASEPAWFGRVRR
jgi:hypothetical protein